MINNAYMEYISGILNRPFGGPQASPAGAQDSGGGMQPTNRTTTGTTPNNDQDLFIQYIQGVMGNG